jgi:hypothetical protein
MGYLINYKGIQVIQIVTFVLLSVNCKTSRQQSVYDYQEEHCVVNSYNLKNTKLPLIVCIPENLNSVISEPFLTNLAKKNRVISISFLSPENRDRQQQLDVVVNRKNVYSEFLNYLSTTYHDSLIVIAEGLNANIISNYNHAFPINTEVYINPYSPSLYGVFTQSCYAQPNEYCNSLLHNFGFSERAALDSMITAVSLNTTDRIYGNKPLQFWTTAINYPLKDKRVDLNRSIIYTSESGFGNPKRLRYYEIIIKEQDLNTYISKIIRNQS